MQTTVSLDPSAASAGQIADEGVRYVRSLICADDETAPDGLDMGLAVFYTDDDTNGRARSALGAVSTTGYHFLGVCVKDASKATVNNPLTDSDYDFSPGDAFACMRLGRVHVYCENGVDPTLPVWVRVVATGDEVAGTFRTSADSTDCILLEGARWVSTTDGEGLAILELDFANNATDNAYLATLVTAYPGLAALVATGTTAGDLIVCTGAGTYERLGVGSEGQVLKIVSGLPAWAADAT